MNDKKGFTMIELLLVVAIMGLLIAIILVSLSSIRDSAKDTRILSSLEQLRSVAQDFHTKNLTYSGLAADYYFSLLSQDIKNMGGTDPMVAIATNGSGYCVYTKLNNGEYCCIDDSFIYKCYGNNILLEGNCKDGDNYKCE